MMAKLEELILEFDRGEVQDLQTFLKMVQEIRRMDDGSLAGLAQVLDDFGNPSRWNMKRVVRFEMERRKMLEAQKTGWMMSNYPSDIPAWKDVFPRQDQDKSGTQVPLDDVRSRPTKPCEGDR
jgi:hypothetical protein